MNNKEKTAIRKIVTILVVTIGFIVSVSIYKDHVNRNEILLGLEMIGQYSDEYLKDFGYLPSDDQVDSFIESRRLVRLDSLIYRSSWVITEKSDPKTILAFARRDFNNPFVQSGFGVLFLDGSAKWLAIDEFADLAHRQFSDNELEFIKVNHPQLKLD